MGSFRYTPQGDGNHRAAKSAARVVPPPDSEELIPRPAKPVPVATSSNRNVNEVLSLGDVRYVLFRHRTYAIAPVPFKVGQKVAEQYEQTVGFARDVALSGAKDAATRYYRGLNRLADMMWTHIRPTKRWRRVMRRLHLLKNPIRGSSEKEIQDLVNFFLQCRMKSSVRSISEAELESFGIRTS